MREVQSCGISNVQFLFGLDLPASNQMRNHNFNESFAIGIEVSKVQSNNGCGCVEDFCHTKDRCFVETFRDFFTSTKRRVECYTSRCVAYLSCCNSVEKIQSADFWLAVSTHLKNISQIGSSPQVRLNIKKCLKPPPRYKSADFC